MLYIQIPLNDIFKIGDKKEKASEKKTDTQKKLRELEKEIEKRKTYSA